MTRARSSANGRPRSALPLLVLLALPACGDKAKTETPQAVTFWQDVAPIYNEKCVRCHQAGGIAPFALDNFADARAHAAAAKEETQAGTMPPYFQVNDGSCGDFHDEATLSAAQKDVIAQWVDGGRNEGTPVTLTLPPQDHLTDATAVSTPVFAPVAQGSAVAMHDEYRCFAVDLPVGGGGYLTRYEVRPGTAAIVHHVLGFIVDPARKTGSGRSNAEVMAKLHADAVAAEGRERDGWPCFGAAGEGVEVDGVPITWAPGQGVVSYPAGMGAPFPSTSKMVFQIHYNLEDPASAGLTDHTTVVFHEEPAVARQLAFLLPDPFLDSLGSAMPASLPPGQARATYHWSATLRNMGLDAAGLDLVGIMPHMHGRGLRQLVELGAASAQSCISDIEHWDFHWQEMYFYKAPVRLHPTDRIDVTCEYDTSKDTAPVTPGWGTQNEMCLPVMAIALPSSS